TLADSRDKPAIAAARRLVVSLLASIGANDLEKHAAVFKAFEELSGFVDLKALAARRPLQITVRRPMRRQILVIKLSALGDFIQALGPATAIRRHHARDELTLLTTPAFAQLGQSGGL